MSQIACHEVDERGLILPATRSLRDVTIWKQSVCLFATFILMLAFSSEVFAQAEPEFYNDQPYAPNEWNIGRRMDQSEFRYCIDQRDPSWEQDGAIADALAQGLLLQPQRYVIPSEIEAEDLTKIYAILLEKCDIIMGFKLIPSGYPAWLTATRAYKEIGYSFITQRTDIKSLAELPPLRAIAATGGTTAHIRLVSYNLSQPVDKRWLVYPYGGDQLALSAVLNKTADLALVWESSFLTLQQKDPAYSDFRIISSAPLPPTLLGVGGVILKQNTFLRSAVDQAITALSNDGTIKAILNKTKSAPAGKP